MDGKLRNQHGFSMVEMLMVVAILAILGAIATIGVVSALHSHQQMERDDDAKAAFLAAQDNLTALVAKGQLSAVKTETAAQAEGDTGNLVTSNALDVDTTVFTLLLPDLSTDRTGTYYIEYNPAGAYIYSVFYVAGGDESTKNASYSTIAGTTDVRTSRDVRMDLKVGYYAGDTGNGNGGFNQLENGTFHKNDVELIVQDNFKDWTDSGPFESFHYRYAQNQYGPADETDDTADEDGKLGKSTTVYYYNGSFSPKQPITFAIVITSKEQLDVTNEIPLQIYSEDVATDGGTLDLTFVVKEAVYNKDATPQWSITDASKIIDNEIGSGVSGFSGSVPVGTKINEGTEQEMYVAAYQVTVTLGEDARNSGASGCFLIDVGENKTETGSKTGN